MPDVGATLPAIRLAAMNLLAMREHSARELYQKLGQKFGHEELVGEAIAALTQENLQSDDRYTEAFVTMRRRQGKGPVRILQELKEKGISGDVINDHIDPADSCWFASAAAERQKRFGASKPGDMKEKARQMRFLQYRGFTQSQISAAINLGE